MKQTRRQFVRTLFIATQAAAVGSLLPRSIFAADVPRGSLNFLLLGDWGRNGEPDQTAVATQMGIAAGNLNARFVISVGDNFYEDGVASATDPQWQSSFEQVYAAPSLQVPWHVALGNHDYHGNCDAQIEYAGTSKRWNMPARYFARTETIDAANAVDFFFLDTTPMSTLDPGEMKYHGNLKSQDLPRQVAWFESALKASTAPWKIAIGHQRRVDFVIRLRRFVRHKARLPAVGVHGSDGENAGQSATGRRAVFASEPVMPFPAVENKFRGVDGVTVPELRVSPLPFGECRVRPGIFPAYGIPIIHMKRDGGKILP